MPKPKHRKNAPARQHCAMPRAVQAQASAMTHHDSLPASDKPQMTHHDSLSGNANPQMTQNDSLFQASNPEMTQNDSLFQASMPQMTQNDSHFEVFSFEMTQNDSFSGLKCPTEHPLSVADGPPATPPSPQNDTLPGDPNIAGQPFAAGPLPKGISPVASSILSRRVILNGAKNLHHIRETLHSAQGSNKKTLRTWAGLIEPSTSTL